MMRVDQLNIRVAVDGVEYDQTVAALRQEAELRYTNAGMVPVAVWSRAEIRTANPELIELLFQLSGRLQRIEVSLENGGVTERACELLIIECVSPYEHEYGMRSFICRYGAPIITGRA